MVYEVNWEIYGEVCICEKGWPKFPNVPKKAGLYRISMNDGRVYIGESINLSNRLYNYRRPTPGIEQEYRVYKALVDAGGGSVEVFVDYSLSDKVERCRLEKAEIKKSIEANCKLVNNEGSSSVEAVKAKIDFLEKELSKAKVLLYDLEDS